MNKFSQLQDDVFDVLNGLEWTSENIQTVPTAFFVEAPSAEYVRVTVMSGKAPLNNVSVAGLIIFEIFTPANTGPVRATAIADTLNNIFSGKNINTFNTHTTFVGNGTLVPNGVDKDNPGLFKSTLSFTVSLFKGK